MNRTNIIHAPELLEDMMMANKKENKSTKLVEFDVKQKINKKWRNQEKKHHKRRGQIIRQR